MTTLIVLLVQALLITKLPCIVQNCLPGFVRRDDECFWFENFALKNYEDALQFCKAISSNMGTLAGPIDSALSQFLAPIMSIFFINFYGL